MSGNTTVTKDGITIEDNIPEFRQMLNRASKETLAKIGVVVLDEINIQTPKRTGALQKINNFAIQTNDVGENTLVFISDAMNLPATGEHGKKQAPYNRFIHMGTAKMHANPYITRAIKIKREEIGAILTEGYKV